MARSVAPCLVFALLALSSSVDARDLMGLNGHRNGVAFADESYYYVSNGNGTWSMAGASLTVGMLGSYEGVSVYPSTSVFPMDATFVVKGVQSVTFPSKGLGLAVGAAPKTFAASANNLLTSAGPTYTKAVPSIMMSLDGGDNWLQVDNIPAVGPAYVPDLNAVFCANKLVCWAAGGVFDTANNWHSAAILITTNGGLSWSYSLCPDVFGPPITGGVDPTSWAAGQNLDGCPTPAFYLPQTTTQKVGTIFDIGSDSSGMHVFAVGAFVANSLESSAILYSGNGGINWVMQTAPAFMSVNEYTLFGVAVATGKVAFACGGQARPSTIGTNDAIGGNGVVLMTTNGGYSWVPQYIVGNYTGESATGVAGAMPFNSAVTFVQGGTAYSYSTPLFTDIFFNRNKNVNSTVWVVGQSAYDNAAAFNTMKADYTTNSATTDYLPCYSIFAAVLRNGLGSTNVTLTFNLISPQTLPPSYAESNACGNDLYGVVFDNTNHGWIYGIGTILVTQNGGLTWQYETPNSLIVLAQGSNPTNPTWITALANVPSNY